MTLDELARAHGAMTGAHKKLDAAELPITPTQTIVLAFISGETKPVTMGAVSRYMQVTAAVGTGLIDRLEKRGLVARAMGTGDRRVTHIEITSAGEEMLFRAGAALRSEESA